MDSQHFTRCFARCFPETSGAPCIQMCSLLLVMPLGEPRACPCHEHHSPALTGTGHSLSSEKHQMLPAFATSSRSQGQSEPAGAAAWQKPPLTEDE